MKKYIPIFFILLSIILYGCSNINATINESSKLEQPTSQETIIQEETKKEPQETETIPVETSEIKETSTVLETVIQDTSIQEETTSVFHEEIIIESTTIPQEPEYKNITLSFVGDTYLGDILYNHYKEANNNVLGFVDETILNNFTSVDIMIANHEYASTDLPNSKKDKRQLYNFKAPTDRETIWHELGVDVLSLANNHIMDYGEQSLFDTIETLDNLNLANIGAGANLKEAKEAYITEINGKKIAILASCRFVVAGDWYATEDTSGVLTTYTSTPYFDIVKKEITRLKEEEKCDFVAIYVHFGTEHQNTPNKNQPIIAHGYIDAGADLVVGAHAHTLQGIEFYKNKPIYYNLGNFLFVKRKLDTMIINISINEDNTCNTSIIPCIAENFKVETAQGSDYERILKYVESISINAVIDEFGNVTESK